MELTKEQISQIEDLTDNNDHTSARLLLISCLDQKDDLFFGQLNEQLQDGYNFIESQQNKLQYLPDHLSTMRRNLDSLLKTLLFKLVSNADQVWQAL